MTTDAQILTAAREVHAAHEAHRLAKQEKILADQEAGRANDKVIATVARVQAAEKRMLDLSRIKPAEPAPRVEPSPVPPEPVHAAEERVEQVSHQSEHRDGAAGGQAGKAGASNRVQRRAKVEN